MFGSSGAGVYPRPLELGTYLHGTVSQYYCRKLLLLA